jgi:hypothetical protein
MDCPFFSRLSNDFIKYELMPRLWHDPSERYAALCFARVSRASYALALETFKTWNVEVDLSSLGILVALVMGRQYDLLKDVFCSLDVSPAEMLSALGQKASILTYVAHAKTTFQLRPLAYFSYDWKTLIAKCLPALLDALVRSDDWCLLEDFGNHTNVELGTDTVLKAVLRGNRPILFQTFLAKFPHRAEADAHTAILRSDQPLMWKIALSKISFEDAFRVASETSQFSLLTFLCEVGTSCPKLVAQSLQSGDVNVFKHVWSFCGYNLRFFFRAWESLESTDLFPGVLEAVAERCWFLEEDLYRRTARDIMSSVHFLSFLKQEIPEGIIKCVVHSVALEEKFHPSDHALFDALLNLHQEKVTRLLFDTIIDFGHLPMFQRGRDEFCNIEISHEHILCTLGHGIPEILRALFPRGPITPRIIELVREILEEEEVEDAGAREAALLVLADKRCVNISQ